MTDRHITHLGNNCIGGVMVGVLVPSVIVGSGPDLVKPKNMKIDICCLSAEHAALRSKSKD